jgi:hypothetical protein
VWVGRFSLSSDRDCVLLSAAASSSLMVLLNTAFALATRIPDVPPSASDSSVSTAAALFIRYMTNCGVKPGLLSVFEPVPVGVE